MTESGLHLFEGFGLELEYMVVDRQTLDVRPVADLLFLDFSGTQVSDVDNGAIAWSNELTAHVVEVKTNGPTLDLLAASRNFQLNIVLIDRILDRHGSMLLPGACHPWMDPAKEMVLWPHDAHEIYALYNTIFDCRGHGWANLQSAHLNLPFCSDAEFARLHTAIRLLLPLLPALTASSPILDGHPTGWLDSRLKVYLHNQDRLPVLTGRLIPEVIGSESEYEERIFQPIMAAIAPFDPSGIMDKYFLNARGAIARFDRGAIEIRILDVQECPMADCSIAQLIIEVLRGLTSGSWSDAITQGRVDTEMLRDLFLQVIQTGDEVLVSDTGFLQAFGLPVGSVRVRDIWQILFERCRGQLDAAAVEPLMSILSQGSLAARIMRGLEGDYRRDNLRAVYRRLADCLKNNKLFLL